MNSYPAFLQIKHFKCIVVGGGNVAARKVKGIIEAGALPAILAPEFCDDLMQIIKLNNLEIIQKEFAENDTSGYQLVIAATNNKELNNAISSEALAAHLLVNNVTSVEHSNFFVPATVRRSPLELAIGTSGEVPFLSRKLKKFFESIFPANIGDDIREMKEERDAIIARAANDEILKKELMANELDPMIEKFIAKITK